MSAGFKQIFGPVPSRRLGRSLGVNNVPYKACSYACVYCQVGVTKGLTTLRRPFYPPEEISKEVLAFLKENRADYVTFVPDGEPLLDLNLGREIELIKAGTPTPVAIITNASLLFLDDARSDALKADLVSVKVDSTREATWKRVDRPHPGLRLEDVMEGIRAFSREFKGRLITETMLVRGMNTSAEELEDVAGFIREIGPSKAYISVPTRPPSVKTVRPPAPDELLRAYSAFSRELGEERVELLNMPEPPEFQAGWEPGAWLLSLVSVHPISLDYAIRGLQGRCRDPEKLVRELHERGEIRVVKYEGKDFIIRNFEPQLKH